MTHSSSGAFSASNKASHTPFCASRRKRRHTELGLPNRSGKSAHGTPVRISHTTALKNRRLSLAVTPQSVVLPESSGATTPHWRSVIS